MLLSEVGTWDQSLPSLQFSESSLDGRAAALEHVLEMVDKTLGGEWSSEDANERDTRHSTPEPLDRGAPLELVGREVKTHIRQFRPTKLDPLGQRKNKSQSAGNVEGRTLQRTKSGHAFTGTAASQLKPSSSVSKTRGRNIRKPRNYNVKD